MKYIKLFENFSDYSNLEDAKWIVISHLGEVEDVEIDSKWNAKDILRLELLEAPTEDKIKRCEEHLKEEGFFLFMTGTDWSKENENVSIIIGVGSSLEDGVTKWLDDNFSNLKRVDYGTTAFFTEDHNLTKINVTDIPRSVIFYTDPVSLSHTFTKVNWSKLWQFLDHDLFLNRDQIRGILKNWIEKTYGLEDIPPLDWANI
jgi:hypothetical protein